MRDLIGAEVVLRQGSPVKEKVKPHFGMLVHKAGGHFSGEAAPSLQVRKQHAAI